MKKRGYQPAISRSKDLQNLVVELGAYDELMPDLLKTIDDVASDLYVTEAELERDYGFTKSALRILKRWKQLVPTVDSGRRGRYSLARALKTRVLLPGLAAANGIRTVRKHNNITTICRDYLSRITEPGNQVQTQD